MNYIGLALVLPVLYEKDKYSILQKKANLSGLSLNDMDLMCKLLRNGDVPEFGTTVGLIYNGCLLKQRTLLSCARRELLIFANSPLQLYPHATANSIPRDPHRKVQQKERHGKFCFMSPPCS